MFFYIVSTPTKLKYLPHPLYEVPAIRVNTSKGMYTFTSVWSETQGQVFSCRSPYKMVVTCLSLALSLAIVKSSSPWQVWSSLVKVRKSSPITSRSFTWEEKIVFMFYAHLFYNCAHFIWNLLQTRAFGCLWNVRCFLNIMKNGTLVPFSIIFWKLLKCKKYFLENIWKFELFIENDAMF